MRDNQVARSFESSRLKRWLYKSAFSQNFLTHLAGQTCCSGELDQCKVHSAHAQLSADLFVHQWDHSESDLLIISGPITYKYLPHLLKLYEEMMGPKWVMVVGSCALTGGLMKGPMVVENLESYLPVDVFVPGCPVHGKDVLAALQGLFARIQQGEPT